MNNIEERAKEVTEDNNDRRHFLKRSLKYLLGFAVFGLASLFGFKRTGNIRLGKMHNVDIGLSEAHGKCGSAYDCTGGGGSCGSAYDCSGGGGKCGSAYNCSGGGSSDDDRGRRRDDDYGGGGKCGSAYDCSGGGGKCGSAYDCSGGGGKCGSAYNCSGN